MLSVSWGRKCHYLRIVQVSGLSELQYMGRVNVGKKLAIIAQWSNMILHYNLPFGRLYNLM